MGLSDWFSSEPPPPPPAPGRRFHDDRSLMFDLEGTSRLAALFAAPGAERSAEWVETFWATCWTASIALAEEQIFTGPDGFPYLRLDLPAEGAFESQCLANVAPHCLQNLVGAAFFPSPEAPPEAVQFVLSLGQIDSLLRYDSPHGDPIDAEEARLPPDEGAFRTEEAGSGRTMVVEQAHNILFGAPSADYLPPSLARSLYIHLVNGWGMADPGVALIADIKMRPRRSLVIGRKRSEFPEGARIDPMVQALLWHLDPGRMLMLMPEDWEPPRLTPLAKLFEGK